MENSPPRPAPAAPPATAQNSGFAITSLILGIVSLIGGFLLIVPPLLAVIFGHVSLSQTKKNPALGGRGMGIAGLVMGYVAFIPCLFFTVGLFAAISIPAFQKVRIASQEKAMLNNARMLSAAADQFCLEHGTTVASFADLVGPDKYVKSLRTVDREQYPVLFERGHGIVVVKKDGHTVNYNP
jgi:type IV pilus assembly protein PilA